MTQTEIFIGPHRTELDQAVETRRWREAYNELVEKLGELGTEVQLGRTLETDQDCAPHAFVRGAVHEFVFPPQEPAAVLDTSHAIDLSLGYELQRQEVTKTYDESLAEGKLRVSYDDAQGSIAFKVEDLMDPSKLDKHVVAAIAKLEPVTAERLAA